MRVALVCPYSLTAPGGVQSQVVGLARALGRLGHDTEIVAPGEVPGDLRGINVGRSFGFRVNGSVAPMAPQPAAAARTVRALRGGGFDVVHLHEPLAPSITIPALLAHPAPVIATFHAAGHRTPYRWLGGPARRLAMGIDARVAVSEPAAQLARRHLGGSYQLLFNGIDVARFRGVPRADGAGRTILFLGRHEHRKGLDVLLDALCSLPPDVTVRVAGDGPITARLRASTAATPASRGSAASARPTRSANSALRQCSVRPRATANRSGSSWSKRWPLARRPSRVTCRATDPSAIGAAQSSSCHPVIPPHSPQGYCAYCPTVGLPPPSVPGVTATSVASRWTSSLSGTSRSTNAS